MKLITNNPKFKSEKYRDIDIEYYDAGYLDILIKVRDLVYRNYELVTHPLYGSVKPNETIYRSVVIKEGNVIGVLDIDSDTLNSFDETDARYLREICTYIG